MYNTVYNLDYNKIFADIKEAIEKVRVCIDVELIEVDTEKQFMVIEFLYFGMYYEIKIRLYVEYIIYHNDHYSYIFKFRWANKYEQILQFKSAGVCIGLDFESYVQFIINSYNHRARKNDVYR